MFKEVFMCKELIGLVNEGSLFMYMTHLYCQLLNKKERKKHYLETMFTKQRNNT